MSTLRLILTLGTLAGLLCGQVDKGRLEQIVTAHVASKDFMGAVLVAKGDEIVLSEGYGSADLEWNIPNF